MQHAGGPKGDPARPIGCFSKNRASLKENQRRHAIIALRLSAKTIGGSRGGLRGGEKRQISEDPRSFHVLLVKKVKSFKKK